jgi:hypothetical protein
MTDNTEEEHLDTPTNMESENISNDTIPITETENIPQNQETENMEVHHHPKVEHKSLKGYLLEGLMIFLAVTMGYVAENIREHFVEKEREEQYIKSFLEDLTNDEQNLPRLVNSLNRQIKEADSLQLLLPNLDTKTRANNCYLFLRSLIRQQDISLFIKDRTIVQLKNTGGMRLLQNKNILDSLLSYYQKIEFVKYLQNMLLEMKMLHKTLSAPLLNNADYHKLIDSTDHLINPQENLYLRTLDPVAINNCLLNVSDIKGLSSVIKIRIINIKESARNLKYFIAKEYHLKNE